MAKIFWRMIVVIAGKWVQWLFANFFLFITCPQGKKNRDATVERLRYHIRDSFIPRSRNWMVLFPEGGFLRKRCEASQRYGEKHGLPYLKNVTLPRTGAMQAILESLPTRTSMGNNNGGSKRVENGNLLTVTSEGAFSSQFPSISTNIN